ncbi:hypothetical protein [Diaphorobacter nitroreducens]|uniref:hypothetical protein n=1 Tax=Diaphorobacter nitroreducens TaxID=164759 RepID=UPI0024E266EA|nr:hypothetical protein [Diaphorobacter nitroreducens]
MKIATLVLCGALLIAPLARAMDCGGQVRLTEPVPVSAEELAEFRAMAPLRVLSADAPPMAGYDQAAGGYSGISVDVLCFIASRIGLRYEILDGRGQSAAEKNQAGAGRRRRPLHAAERPGRAHAARGVHAAVL